MYLDRLRRELRIYESMGHYELRLYYFQFVRRNYAHTKKRALEKAKTLESSYNVLQVFRDDKDWIIEYEVGE